MKKALLFASLVGASLFANAQVSIGPKVGLGLSNFRYTVEEGEKPETKAVFSPSVGLALNIKLGDYFALQPGLQYAMLGTKVEEGDFKSKTTTHNIQLPVLIKIQYPVSDNFAIGLGVGPYLGYMVGGQVKTEMGDESSTTKIKGKSDVSLSDYEKDEDVVYSKPLDLGLVIAPYVEVSNFQIALNYNLGLSNLSPKFEGEESETKTYNSWYGVSLAYFFGGK